MKSVLTRTVQCGMCFLLLTVFTYKAGAQDGLNKRANVPMATNVNGFLEYLPTGYTAGSQTYPLIIMTTGLGTTGSGDDAALENLFTGAGYPHEQQRNHSWQEYYTVNNQTFQFIIITPQFVQPMNLHTPTPDEIEEVINYSILHYRVDTSRIYLVGASQGGAIPWEYPSSSSARANRIAAAVPFAAVTYPFPERANIMKNANLPIWAFHNRFDDLVPPEFTIQYLEFFNEYGNPPSLPARGTIFNAGGHLCYFLPLTRQYGENGMDIYQWMLQYKRTFSKAFAGEDREFDLPSSSIQLAGSGTGPNGTTAAYAWQKLSGPAGGNFNNTNTLNPTVSNLSAGTYFFRLTITDNNGSSNTDDVAITVHPQPIRIEAESFFNSDGNIILTSNGTVANALDNDDWMQYHVTVPSAGLYHVRFRVGSFYGASKFAVYDSVDHELTRVNIWVTDFVREEDMYRTIPLAAGTQTIKIKNIGGPYQVWFFNYFDVLDKAGELAPLPVKFTLFSANCGNDRVNLMWKTAGESNSKTFDVERSGDGRNWTSIATVAAGGNSTQKRTYVYSDISAGSLYRIVANDADGKKTMSSVIKVNCDKGESLALYPNPVREAAVITMNLASPESINLSVIDSKGAVVRRQLESLPQGTSQVELNMAGLPAGVYSLSAQWNAQNRNIRFVKK